MTLVIDSERTAWSKQIMDNRQIVTKLPKEGGLEVSLNSDTPWLVEILSDLNGELRESDFEGDEKSTISFQGELIRKWNERFNDYIILEGEVKATFFTLEINSGDVILEHMNIPVKACWIQEELKEKLGYEDETEIWFDEDEYDLYYYTRNNVELKPVLHEYVFLNKDPYPGLSEPNTDH
ncbi:MAG: hypothetical protein KC493_05865 [Bacteriovoracaceae bacterium]|nr:hypothetical protein [Bacteriovoracaceae bacterium]